MTKNLDCKKYLRYLWHGKKSQKSLVVPHFLVPCSHRYHPVARIVQYFIISSQSRSFSFISTWSFIIICFFYQFDVITQLFFLFTQSYNKKPSTQSRHHTHMTYLTFHIDNTLTLRDQSQFAGHFWWGFRGGGQNITLSILNSYGDNNEKEFISQKKLAMVQIR